MKIYTGRGDEGTTDLLGERVHKHDPRIDVLGSLDEATSAIGFARSLIADEDLNDDLVTVQQDLYQIMAELAFVDPNRRDAVVFEEVRQLWLSNATDLMSMSIELPREFVLPGDSVTGAALDVARTVVRRAERFTVALHTLRNPVNPVILQYLNRLSSFLFIAARAEDLRHNTSVRLAKTTPD